jgi:hypothetical protein
MNLTEKQMSYINELISEKESDNLPLTKPKKIKEFKVVEEQPSEPITEPFEEIKTKPKKPRPPKSEKQMEAFQKAQSKRHDVLKTLALNKKLEASKLLLQNDVKLMPEKKEKTVIQKDESSDDEPEIIYVKKPKKKKKIIIEESSDDDSEDEVIIKKKDWGNTQRNRKSVVKIGEQKPQPTLNKPTRNFFCD